MSASSPVHRPHVDAEDGELIHLTVNDADYFLGVGSNTVLLPRTCEPIMLDTEDPQIDIAQLIWRGPDHTPQPSSHYRLVDNLDDLITSALDGVLEVTDEHAPVATDERLDHEQEQRLGYLTSAVLDLLFQTSPPIIPIGHAGVVDSICVDDFYDGDGLLDGLSVVSYLRLGAGGGLETKGPQLFIDRITRTGDLDGATGLADQLRAFTHTVLGQVSYTLSAQLDFYRAAMAASPVAGDTPPAP